MEYSVQVEQQESHPLAVVRHLAKMSELSKIIPDSCGAVWKALRDQKVSGAGRHVTIYWDDQIRLEVGVELEAPFAGIGDVVGSATPSGLVATTTHYGPYGLLPDAHTALRQWCADNDHRLAGPFWEIYGHWVDEWNDDPSKISTTICYLLDTNGNSGG